MSFGKIVIISLIIAFFAVLPTWPHSSEWGYYPTALIGILLLMATVLVEMGGM